MSAALARREIRARPGRFAWLIVAVTVAVGFTVGAFGFSTQLTGLLDPSATGASGLDVLPEGSVVLTADTSAVTSATALDESLLATVRGVTGVALAEGTYDQPVAFRLEAGTQTERPVILRGVVLSSTYAPQRWTMVDGREPRGPDEVVADLGGLVVGQTAVGDVVTMELPTGARQLRVVGLAVPAGAGAAGAAQGSDSVGDPVPLASAHAILDPAIAPLLLDAVGRVDRITVVPVPGVDPGELEDRVRAAVPDAVRVTSSLTRAATTQHTVERIDDGVRQAVAAFAGLTVLISALVVTNTLGVLVAQRTREFGLLRLVGASRAQVLRTVLGESLVVGLIGAVLGAGLGVVLAYLAALVVRESTVPVGFEATPTMAIVALGVGVVVTLVGGALPAVRAGRVAPMAALSDTRSGADRPARFAAPAIALAGGLAVAGFAATRPGGVEGPLVAVAAVGVLVAFAGIAGLSRWVVRPLVAVIGTVVAATVGAAGRLGVGNVRRSPGRTAGAASTLMVGLALVGLVATVGASVRSTVESQFDTVGSADLYLERRGVVRVSTPALEVGLAGAMRRGFRFASVTTVDGSVVGDDGATTAVSASFLPELAELVDLGVTEGAVPEFTGEPSPAGVGLLLSESTAADLGLGVGDTARLRSISGTETPVRVAALFTNTAVAGDAVLDVTALDPGALGTFELGILRFEGRHGDRSVRAVERAARDFPKVRVHTPRQFGALNAAVTDTVLRIIGVVLVGMIGIGYLGLVATLGLATLERRKELVMLRAIGAARAQVRTMVWVEATLVGLVAAVVGLGTGVALGRAGAALAPPDLVGRVVVPWGLVVAVGVVSLVLAWAVSIGVARRAGGVPPAEAGRNV